MIAQKEKSKLFVHIQNRNIRYLFLVDIDSMELVNLFIKNNKRLWGGKFNPIIPACVLFTHIYDLQYKDKAKFDIFNK